MTNEEKRLRIEALESELLSDVSAKNFAEKTEALLACDRLYFSYASRYISGDRANEPAPELTLDATDTILRATMPLNASIGGGSLRLPLPTAAI